MRSVIFILFDNRADSIRRFLLVSDSLYGLGIKSYFLDSTSSLLENIKEYAETLKISRLPEYIRFDAFSPDERKRGIKLHKEGRKISDLFDDFSIQKGYPESNTTGQLLDALHISNKALIDLHIQKELASFMSDLAVAEKILDSIRPLCVIHDTELPQRNRALFFAAQKRMIHIISMLHGEGPAEQIDQLPLISDSYIAYGEYNAEKLKGMGADENRVFLTGNPDTDLLFNYDAGSIRRELAETYKIDFSKKIFLIALRPNADEAYFKLNIELLDMFKEVLGDNGGFEIVVKQHPVDVCRYVTTDYTGLFASKYNKMKFIKGDFIISKLFAVSDYFMTHKSSAIVEAVIQKVHVIVIENDDAKWPDWNRFNVYDAVRSENVKEVLAQIGNGFYKDREEKSGVRRDEFVHYFRYRYDNNSVRRVAEVIARITGDMQERMNTARLLNRQGEEYFVQGDMEKAKDALVMALEADPGYSVPYNNLGVLFWQSGEADKALQHFAAALKTDPFEQNAVLNYGAVLTSMEQYGEAGEVYNSYLRVNPDDKDVSIALLNLQSQTASALKCEENNGSGQHSDRRHVPENRSVPEADILKYTNRVSFELSNLCNYAGIHPKCPLHQVSKPVILPAGIVYDVTDTLAEYNFKGTIAFHTYNEPLIDPRLFMFIKYARHACPGSHIYICTNGYYFNEMLAQEMTEAGVSEIHISAYSQSEFDRLSSIKPAITYNVEMMKLDARLDLYDREENSMGEPCFAPLNEIIIGREGVISLCCLDWRRDYSFGDLHTQSFKDVLKTGELHAVYERLSRGDRFLPACRRCGWVR